MKYDIAASQMTTKSRITFHHVHINLEVNKYFDETNTSIFHGNRKSNRLSKWNIFTFSHISIAGTFVEMNMALSRSKQ